MAFAGLGFLAFYLAGKLHLFDRRGHAGKAWLSLMPFCGAALVAISRTMDYRHHWQDVLVGSLLGTVMSYFSYRQYFPSLASELSHRPYSPRIKQEDEDLPTHYRHGSTVALNPQENAGDDYPPAMVRRYTDDLVPSESYELGHTVKRPDPGPLHEIWRAGEQSDSGQGSRITEEH